VVWLLGFQFNAAQALIQEDAWFAVSSRPFNAVLGRRE
jgi:hypothetical protein